MTGTGSGAFRRIFEIATLRRMAPRASVEAHHAPPSADDVGPSRPAFAGVYVLPKPVVEVRFPRAEP